MTALVLTNLANGPITFTYYAEKELLISTLEYKDARAFAFEWSEIHGECKNLVCESLCAQTILNMSITVSDNFSFARRSYSEGIKWLK